MNSSPPQTDRCEPDEDERKLLIVSSVPVAMTADGDFRLSKKFIAGILEHDRYWSGRVQVLMEPAPHDGSNLDYISVAKSDLPFDLVAMKFSDGAVAHLIRGSAVVLLMLYQKQFPFAKLCRDQGVPFVYTTEYTLKTRLQIIASETHSPVKRLAKNALEFWRELRARRAVGRADGIQSNGTPTHDVYRRTNPSGLLFFDTRVTQDLLVSDEVLDRRLSDLRNGSRALRLAFSGRLTEMKGADHLIRVADHLKAVGIDFSFSIFGDGNLRQRMRSDISRLGLDDCVSLMGTVDFESELVPFVAGNVDVFVCCHRQGDPSCTYLETMSCGVPIIGYANEAFEGLRALSGAGWVSPMGDPQAMATRIASLATADIEEQAKRSLAFAKSHTFEAEFAARMEQLQRIADGLPQRSEAKKT